MLEVRGLCKRFGALAATQSVDLALAPGARHALIGPNGAGKTTLVNLLTGHLAPDSGSMTLDGADLLPLRPHQRVRAGLVRTFQINSLFMEYTPLQSVALAIAQREGDAMRMWGFAAAGRKHVEEAGALLHDVGLGNYLHERTDLLPYGLQRLLEVALALACKPKVLLLDEPAAGVSTDASQRLFDLIDRLPGDLAILLIEHDMRLVFRFAQRISVLVAGAVLTEGTPAEIAADPKVREVYLGSRHAA
ncbi:MAG: ABC transporter ATP-binding protein [Pigmentiphaga sp.]|uniref:ABC transporter ATP-binding protein n=1 Tax=Pigmentiphaga sp. TaxID=1977564 RepID=UPI0029A17991|nr:ABC transporter ATP-binding protein [Pigmentiphaga sp.]MDX3905900.1 ABC transporter ATP-binding protein [Pigmentiphaga sp.]